MQEFDAAGKTLRVTHPQQHRAAFSLIELLISLVLLLIMTTMFWGFGSRSNQQKQKALCQKNLQKIFVAMEIYASDFAGRFPVKPGAQTAEEPLSLLVPRYTADTRSFICPGSKDSQLPAGEPFLKRRISYAYIMGRRQTDANEVLMTDRQIDALQKTGGQQIFSTTGKSPGNNHHKYGGNYLFGDGHLETSSTNTPFSISWTQGVSLLNPKP